MAYLHWCHYIGYQVVDGKIIADRPFDTSSCHPEEFYEMADVDLAALAEAGLVIVRKPLELPDANDAMREAFWKKYYKEDSE
jgi:hypothetical protein